MSEKKLKILSPPGAPKIGQGTSPAASTSVKSPMKVGTQATVKMPKAKSLADGFGKPSLFFKKEDFQGIKKPSIEKLRDFLEKTRLKK